MNNKELLIIVIAIIAGCCIIAGAIMLTGSDTPEVKNSTVNNTTNNTTTNITDNVTENDNTNNQQSSSKQSPYYERQYSDTGETHNGKKVVGHRYDPDLPGDVIVYDDGSVSSGG